MSEKNLSSISDSEWEVMCIVWTLGETNTKQILNELQAKKDWTDSTIKTLILLNFLTPFNLKKFFYCINLFIC